jgi:hypothetical protein
MPRVIVVEDTPKYGQDAIEAIVETGLVQRSDIELWLIRDADTYRRCAAKAEQTDAQVMVADLKLVTALTDEDLAIIYAAKEAATSPMPHDKWLWQWDDEKSAGISTGFVLISRFLLKDPDRKSVMVVSNHANDVKQALRDRKPRNSLTTPSLSNRSVLEDDLPTFLKLALGSWEDLLWDDHTSRWFKRVEDDETETLEVNPMKDHDPSPIPEVQDAQKASVRMLLDLPPNLRQTVKTQNPLNGELSHGIVPKAVHQRV